MKLIKYFASYLTYPVLSSPRYQRYLASYSSQNRNTGVKKGDNDLNGNYKGFVKENPSIYKEWYELTTKEKQKFIKDFVKNYKTHYPGSRTNVSLKGLAMGMDEYEDSPSVFGIFYNDIWKLQESTAANEKNKKYETHFIDNRFAHQS